MQGGVEGTLRACGDAGGARLPGQEFDPTGWALNAVSGAHEKGGKLRLMRIPERRGAEATVDACSEGAQRVDAERDEKGDRWRAFLMPSLGGWVSPWRSGRMHPPQIHEVGSASIRATIGEEKRACKESRKRRDRVRLGSQRFQMQQRSRGYGGRNGGR